MAARFVRRGWHTILPNAEAAGATYSMVKRAAVASDRPSPGSPPSVVRVDARVGDERT